MIPIIEGIKDGIVTISEIPNQINTLKEGTIEAIEIIGNLSKIIINAIDCVSTIILNPVIVLSFIDKLSLTIIISLLVLRLLGFNNLKKWILLSILAKVVSMALIWSKEYRNKKYLNLINKGE